MDTMFVYQPIDVFLLTRDIRKIGKEGTISPTVATDSVMITSFIEVF
jgi:hypothetical protein